MATMGKEEAPEFFRDRIVHREWGYRLATLEKYALAIEYFEKAIKPPEVNDLRALIGLCKTFIKFMRYKEAIEISEKSFAIDPDHYQARHIMVETLFHIGEFSYSLIHAHKGLRKRRMPFEYDVYQGNQTIEDCVGRNTHPKALLLLNPWIRKLEKHRQFLISKLEEEEDEFEGIDEDHSRFKVNDPQIQKEEYSRKIQRIITKFYLGKLANDKDFLEDITKYPEKVKSPEKKTTHKLHTMAEICYKRTIRRLNNFRMRRPLYVTLFERRAIPEGHRIILNDEKRLRRNIIIIEADFLLHRLHDVRMCKDYAMFFRLVDRVKDKFDSYSTKMFPLKKKCLAAVYNMVAWAYIETRDLTVLPDEETKMRYLKHHLGIRVAELPRDIDIAWVQVVNKKQAVRSFRRRLAMASDPLEISWLFHEFCKYLIDIRRFDLARFYAKKVRDMAQEAGSELWIVNSNHLTLRVEISQNNRNEAKEAALLAISSSKKLGVDYLIDFYKRAIYLIDSMDLEKLLDFDGIAVRQQLILDLMPEEMKAQVDFLFRSMEVVPARRRLSVMPGCKPIDRKFKLPCKRRTILPNPPKDPEKEYRRALLRQYEPRFDIPGLVNFEEYE